MESSFVCWPIMWCDRWMDSMDLVRNIKHFMKILEIFMGPPTNLWLKEPQLAMSFLGIIFILPKCRSSMGWCRKSSDPRGDLAKSNYKPDIKYKSYIYPSIFLHSKYIYIYVERDLAQKCFFISFLVIRNLLKITSFLLFNLSFWKFFLPILTKRLITRHYLFLLKNEYEAKHT